MPLIPESLILRYNRPGPRYTSYPPVPRWAADGAEDAWSALVHRVDRPVALYAHIPFCVSQCTYCGCNMVVSRRQSAGDRYLDALERQLATLGHPNVQWLHLGGGTPTWLDSKQLARLFALFDDYSPRMPGHETSVEVDPEVTSDDRLDALFEGGVTRVSIGVQSLERSVLEAVGRPQSFAAIQRVTRGARQRGATGVNLDLMVGLPHQTPTTLACTLQQVLELRPDRLAVFGYAHVPWLKRHQQAIDASTLPGPHARATLTLAAHRMLTDAGYDAIGMDHYALPDDPLAVAHRTRTLDRNFMGYTPHRGLPVLGVGMSAISEVDGHFLQQTSHLGRWWRAVEAGRTPVQRSYQSTLEDRIRAEVIRRVLCDQAVDLAVVAHNAGGVPSFDDALRQLKPLQQDGLVEVRGAQVTVTEPGRLFLRNVAMAFDPRMASADGPSSEPRYSQTV